MTIIYFLILLTVIICIHELGHLLAAKLFGVYCYEYSFGMGPLLLKKQTKETQYSLRAIPIGGYVAMAGESGEEAYEDIQVPEGRYLTDKPLWQKLIILLAGVAMNFLLCYLIMVGIVAATGTYGEYPDGTLEAVMEGSPAEKAGLKAGDKIIAMSANGQQETIESFQDISTFIALLDQPELTVTVLRDGSSVEIPVSAETREAENGQKTYWLGIQGGSLTYKNVNPLNCWYYGAKEMGYVASLFISGLRTILAGRHLDQVSGPVGIYTATEQSVSYGWIGYLLLMAELSLNVGVMNLLPLPVLDGGQVVIAIGEAIAGKKLNDKVKLGLMTGCWVLLIGVMLLVTWNDIARLIK